MSILISVVINSLDAREATTSPSLTTLISVERLSEYILTVSHRLHVTEDS